MPEKLDLYKLHKPEYAAPKQPVLITIQSAKYLTAEGAGRPGDEAFQAAIGALFSMAYTIKMARKFAGKDYKVCGLEGLYWGHDPERCLMEQAPDSLHWKLMIRVPDFISGRDLDTAAGQLAAKGKPAGAVKLETLREGKCVQVLHVGPYGEERPTMDRMAAFANRQGVAPRGPHHEIYLSDPRRVPAERLRTILRQPVA